MTEPWVLKKIFEAVDKQPTHRLTQLMVVDEETGEAKVLEVEQVEGQPPVVRKKKEGVS